MYINEYCSVNKGLKLDNNQDNIYMSGFYLYKNNHGIKNYEVKKTKVKKELYYAVFDGIGGLEQGDYASLLCSETLDNIINSNNKKHIIHKINDKLLEIKENANINFGSTAALVKITKKELELKLVGDSSIFVLSKGTFTEYKESEDKVLENYIGNKDVHVRKEKLKLNIGDKIIICSDGLTKKVKESEIEYILDCSSDPKYITDKLINEALSSGGEDNISVITLIVKQEIPTYIYVLAFIFLSMIIIGLITL